MLQVDEDYVFVPNANRIRVLDEDSLTSSAKGTYQAKLNDREEDEYHYENGQLVKIIKKNSLKNFIIRPIGK